MTRNTFLVFISFLWIFIVPISAAPADQEENKSSLLIRTFPEGPLLRGDIIAARGQFDALLHGFSVLNSGDEEVILSRISFEVMAHDEVVAVYHMPLADIDTMAPQHKAYEEHGVFRRFDSVFGFSYLFPPDYALSASNKILSSEGLIFFHKYLAIRPSAEAVRIRAFGKTADGLEIMGELTVPIEVYKSPNKYNFPLSGAWFVKTGPDAGDHHRWSQSSEFAIDAIRVGLDGQSFTEDGASPENYLAYGEPVFAASDGVVIRARVGAETAPVKQPGETFNEFFNQMSHRMNKFFDEDPEQMMGNYVVIQHPGGEYSSYSHLKGGSITVKEGQQVKAGQKIGEVGQSGNSMEPHLHFNVALGPNPLWGRSVPVQFINLAGRTEEELLRSLKSGEFVTSSTPE